MPLLFGLDDFPSPLFLENKQKVLNYLQIIQISATSIKFLKYRNQASGKRQQQQRTPRREGVSWGAVLQALVHLVQASHENAKGQPRGVLNLL